MYGVFRSLNVVLIIANSVDPDEMQHNVAFHLGLQFAKGFSVMARSHGHC